MALDIVDKEQNKRLVTQQTQDPFKKWKAFKAMETILWVNHTINYELPITGKIANVLTGRQSENKIKQGIGRAAQTIKKRLESS